MCCDQFWLARNSLYSQRRHPASFDESLTSVKSPVSSNDPRPTWPHLKVVSVTEKRGWDSSSTKTFIEPESHIALHSNLVPILVGKRRGRFQACDAAARRAINYKDTVVDIDLGAGING